MYVLSKEKTLADLPKLKRNRVLNTRYSYMAKSESSKISPNGYSGFFWAIAIRKSHLRET